MQQRLVRGGMLCRSANLHSFSIPERSHVRKSEWNLRLAMELVKGLDAESNGSRDCQLDNGMSHVTVMGR